MLKKLQYHNGLGIPYTFFAFLILLLAITPAASQETPATDLDSLSHIRAIQLRPLPVLLDLAVQNAPTIRANAVEIAKFNTAQKIQKLAWTDLLQVSLGVQYAKGALLDATNNGAATTYLLSDRQNMFNTIGIGLRIPGGFFWTQPLRNQLAQQQVERYKVEHDIQARGIREDVITLYVQLESALKMLRLKAESLETQRVAFSVAEKYFREGNLSVMDYSTLLGQLSTAEEFLEKVRAETKRFHLLLRELIGGPVFETPHKKTTKSVGK
jgi:outer membrane protein TolC